MDASQSILEKLDLEIKAWSQITRQQLLFRLASLNLEERVRLSGEISLQKSLKSKLRRKEGEIERIVFSFVRHGIFLEHGVGKSRPVRSAKAEASKKPWLSAVLPDAIEELADLLEDRYAEAAIESLKFSIPGIIEIK